MVEIHERFDAAKGQWTALPPLPEPRSSHDVAVIGDQLIVAGGWNLRGAEPSLWHKTALSLDLKNPGAGWQVIPQPFERRALIAAAHRDKMYAIGGITPSGAISTDVNIFDPATKLWSKGPALPGADINGFAPAAAVLGGRLYVSVGDGTLLVLDEAKQLWVEAGMTSARLAHRMVATLDSLLIAGGADKGRNLDLVELPRLAGTER